jgi:hypothetical protein
MARRWLRSLGIAAAGVALLPVAGGLLNAATRTAPCDRAELTASIGTGQTDSQRPASLDHLTIVLVGDAGFNSTDAKVDPKGMYRGKQVIGFTEALSGVARDVDGDLAFINLETVVTDRRRLQSVLARQQSFLRLWRRRHRGDALSCRRGECRAGHRLCRHR